jgi:DNA polymerase-1
MKLKIKNCKGCSLWGGSSKTVIAHGNKNSGVMIIGDTPGYTEIDDAFGHLPYIGHEGGILNWALVKSGFMKDADEREKKCYITNIVKCHPSTGQKTWDLYKRKINVEPYHIRACSKKWLTQEIRKVKPKYVLLLGKNAFSGFTDHGNMALEKVRGFWERSAKHNCWFITTLNPANVLQNGDKTSTFYRDIETFTQFVTTGRIPKPKLGKHYQTLTSFPAVRSLFKKLKKKKRIAYDTETRNIRNYDVEWFPLGMSFCWATGKAAYVPLYGKEKKEIWNPKQKKLIIKWTKEILENRNIKKDGQNIKYDVNVVRHAFDITMHGIDWDTMQAHHLFDETTPANLTFLTTWYRLNFPRYEDEIKPHIGSYVSNRGTKEADYSTVPIPIMGKYACADVDAVWRIRKYQKKLATKRIKRLYYNISTEMSKSAAMMEYHGALIDVKRISKLEKEYDKEVAKVNNRLSLLLKTPNFNVNSPIQMQRALFSDEPGCLNLTQVKLLKGKLRKTPKGKYQTGKDAFDLIRRNVKKKSTIKILDTIQEVRKMRKMKSTYLTGFKKIVDPNNRVHTHYLTTGTVTGRYASEGPNLQNIPRDPIFRSLFIAGPGRKMIPADYSQIEARLVAWLAVEVDYIKQFADPDFDPHYYNSSIVRKKPVSEVTKEERSYDKAVTFGMNYGRSNESIAETYQLPIEFVNNFVYEYFKELKHIAKWRDRQVKIGRTPRENGEYYLESNTGRRRHFHAYQWIYSAEMDEVYRRKAEVNDKSSYRIDSLLGTMERQSFNFKIQSYASDLLSMATAKVRKRLVKEKLDAFLMLSVHDMIGVDSSEKDVKRCAVIIDEEMTFTKTRTNKKTGEKLSLNFPIDFEITDHWVQ